MKLLVVEDDPPLQAALLRLLAQWGYACERAATAAEALAWLERELFDLVLLDLGLPDRDGLSVCRQLRRLSGHQPLVLMLTARDTLDDKITGLGAGADDYLVKPFEVRELEARISTLLRRHRRAVAREIYTVGDLTLDTGTLRVARGGQSLTITPIGMKLLTVLMRASPRVVTRQQLEREVWGDVLPDSDTLRSHLYSLRKAIDKPFDRALLHTIAGAGYRVSDDDGR